MRQVRAWNASSRRGCIGPSAAIGAVTASSSTSSRSRCGLILKLHDFSFGPLDVVFRDLCGLGENRVVWDLLAYTGQLPNPIVRFFADGPRRVFLRYVLDRFVN